MSREKEMIKNTAVLSIGKFLPKLTSFITLPILTACLTKAEYGTYDLITTLIMMVLPIATLQIQSAGFRFLIDYRKDKDGASRIISSILAVTVPISLVVSILMPVFFPDLSVTSKLLLALYFLVDTMYLTLGQITRGLGYNRYYSMGSILISVVNMLGIVATVYGAKQGIQGVLFSLVISQLAGTLFYIKKTGILSYFHRRSASISCIRELLAYSWPMIPNNLSSWVLKLSDRLVITAFLGIQANAVYAVANKIPNLLAVAQQIIVMAWQENASIAVKDKDAGEYYSKMIRFMYDFMFGFTALLIGFMPIMFRILIKGDYDASYPHIPVLILAMFFFAMSSMFGGIYVAHKRTLNVGVTTMVAAALNLVIDLALVNRIGIWAGSVSTLAAYVFLYYYRLINSRKFQPVRVEIIRQLVQLAVLAIMTAVCFKRVFVFDLINLGAGIIFFLVFNRDLVMKVLKKVLRH